MLTVWDNNEEDAPGPETQAQPASRRTEDGEHWDPTQHQHAGLLLCTECLCLPQTCTSEPHPHWGGIRRWAFGRHSEPDEVLRVAGPSWGPAPFQGEEETEDHPLSLHPVKMQ